jgi:hypothetical protein
LLVESQIKDDLITAQVRSAVQGDLGIALDASVVAITLIKRESGNDQFQISLDRRKWT